MKLLVLDDDPGKHLIYLKLLSTNYSLTNYIKCMHKRDSALDNLQNLICHTTLPNQKITHTHTHTHIISDKE